MSRNIKDDIFLLLGERFLTLPRKDNKMSYDQKERIFRLFYKRYFKKIRFRTMRLLKNERHAADDIAQETFMRAYENLDKIFKRSDFLRWTYAVSRNLSYNYKRSKQYRCKEYLSRKLSHDKEALELSDVIMDTKSIAPDTEAERNELLSMLSSAMDKLSSNYRSALQLCSIEGLPYNMAAAELKCSTSAVAHNVMRAKREIMHIIKD